MEQTELTPEKEGWRERFLVALEKGFSVANACRAAKVARPYAYEVRAKDPEFAARWQDALDGCLDELERVATARAKKSSDLLLMFLLKSHRRAVYGEKVDHGGALKVNVVYADRVDPDAAEAPSGPAEGPE